MRWWLVFGSMFAAAMASTPPALPEAAAFSASALDGRIDLEKFDFEAQGYWKLENSARRLWLSSVQTRVMGASVTSNTCNADERRRFAASMWLRVLHQSPDAAIWKVNHDALQKALGAVDEKVRTAAADAPASTDPLVEELARRAARDQAIRDMPTLQKMGEGLPPIANQLWTAMRLVRMMAIDCDNTRWLSGQLHKIKWFDIPHYGATANSDAWVLVQHADRDPAFQREVLARLQALPAGHTNPQNIALLYDRVARAEGRPQRYGTQGTCMPDGSWEMQETEAPEELDARRKSVELPPMAEYQKVFVGLCPVTAK